MSLTYALECPCCGDIGARGEVYDGQDLECGCVGHVSLDAESEPCIVVDCGCWEQPSGKSVFSQQVEWANRRNVTDEKC